jgi:hypothetical protein
VPTPTGCCILQQCRASPCRRGPFSVVQCAVHRPVPGGWGQILKAHTTVNLATRYEHAAPSDREHCSLGRPC